VGFTPEVDEVEKLWASHRTAGCSCNANLNLRAQADGQHCPCLSRRQKASKVVPQRPPPSSRLPPLLPSPAPAPPLAEQPPAHPQGLRMVVLQVLLERVRTLPGVILRRALPAQGPRRAGRRTRLLQPEGVRSRARGAAPGRPAVSSGRAIWATYNCLPAQGTGALVTTAAARLRRHGGAIRPLAGGAVAVVGPLKLAACACRVGAPWPTQTRWAPACPPCHCLLC
jgi:hypothetical protein